MLQFTNKEFSQVVTDLKNTDDIKHYIVTTLNNLEKLYEESENTIDPNLLYSLGDAINILYLLKD